MTSHPEKPEEGGLFLYFAPLIGLLAVLVTAAQAQVNIDQGKSPAEIFANDCAACHKTTRGLAAGKNSLILTSFLREHYTASRDQAAALAAYVLGAGGGEALKPGQKPGQERAKVEEPKTAARPTQQAAKPEVEPPTAKLQPPVGEEAKPEEQPGAEVEPGGAAQRSAGRGRDLRPVTTTRGHKNEHEANSPEPAVVVAAPAVSATPANEAPSPEVSPTTSAAAPGAPGEGEPVPRDNIPD
jgi:mono/diheme cytochrome c family protein